MFLVLKDYLCIENDIVNTLIYMAIPKKITPDHLKDTIVEIRFDPGVPLDLMSGIALTLLNPLGYNYAPIQNSNIALEVGQGQQISIGLGDQNRSGFFIKDAIRIQFIGNVIAFNCFEGKYLGWDSYSKTIKDILKLFASRGFIKSFNRVAIRYISEFKDVDILSNVKGCFDLEETPAGLSLQNTIVRLAKEDSSIKAFVTLTNRTKKRLPDGNIIEISLFDVNVFENLTPNSDFNSLVTSLGNVHLKQKEAFFETITEDFKNSLNPEY